MSGRRTFVIAMSERRHRFRPDELAPHAPRRPGVYELLACGDKTEPEVLYVGLALPGPGQGGTIYDALAAHLMGARRPRREDLLIISPEIYFDYVLDAGDLSPDDHKDIAGALIARNRPRLNPPAPPPSSGRYEAVAIRESEPLQEETP
ncbi:MAG: hypothetical protein ABII00_10110 [Elusimicrobiota bacterium]